MASGSVTPGEQINRAIWRQLTKTEQTQFLHALQAVLPLKDKKKGDALDSSAFLMSAPRDTERFERKAPLLVDSKQRAYYYEPGARERQARIVVVTADQRGGERLVANVPFTINTGQRTTNNKQRGVH